MRLLLRFLAALALALVALVAAIVACEIAVRLIDGQPLTAWRLPPVRPAPGPPRRPLDPTIGGGALPPDVDPAWIDMPPPPLPNRGPIEPELVELERKAQQFNVRPFEVFRVWNRRFVEGFGCQPGSPYARMPPPLLVFDPPEPITYPPYRYMLGRTFPGGLVTNRFGWRGPDIAMDKPPNTVRLAFAGASTTVGLFNMPFSYPEYVAHWLNLWAEHAGFQVRFEGINVGREGVGSTGIAAIIRQELLPVEPDLVVYYEGANQSLCVRLGTKPPPRPPINPFWGHLDRFIAATRAHWRLASRLEELALYLRARGGYEPEKPGVGLGWSPWMDEAHPDITSRNLPLQLPVILKDLESARAALAADGGTLAMSSFVWLVYDGLRLNPRGSAPIYRHLNEGCWPYSYADLRRAIDLHNHALEQYARAHDLPFLDVAATFPLDPDLFFDAIHFNAHGTRAHAWIVFRQLLPVVRARLESGAWPRPDRVPQDEHPHITEGQPLVLQCGTPPSAR